MTSTSCAAPGAVGKVRAGIVAMEGNFGLAHLLPARHRTTAQVRLEEHACASLTAGLRAAAFGVPFQPCGGLHGSDIAELNGWVKVPGSLRQGRAGVGDPRHPAGLRRHPRVRGRLAGQRAGRRHLSLGPHHDAGGQERARGGRTLVDTSVFRRTAGSDLVPYFMVEAFAIVPRGAWPGSCWPHYEIDYPAVEAYLEPGRSALASHLARRPGTGGEHMRGEPGRASPTSSSTWRASSVPNEITFSGVNSTMPMLACLLAKKAYDGDFTYINVAGGVDPEALQDSAFEFGSGARRESASIFANEDFYDLCTRGRMDLTFLGAAQIDGEGCANNSVDRRMGTSQGPAARWRRRRGDASNRSTGMHMAHRAFDSHARREARLPYLVGRLPRRGDAYRRLREARRKAGT